MSPESALQLLEEARDVAACLAPRAAAFDAAGAIDPDVVDDLGRRGLLGASIPSAYGGGEADATTLGRICEEVGSVCSSTRSLITVQGLVAAAIGRWGSDEQRSTWLPRLATGEAIAGFCLTEPDAGSDGSAVTTSVVEDGDDVVVDGTKLWVTFGRLASVFLVVGRHPAGPVAVVVPSDADGVEIEAVAGQLGLRAAMLGHIRFTSCRVPARNVVARPGFGWTHVATAALDHGRYTVAWGCVGIVRGCLETSARYAATRNQFGRPIADHQLIREMLADMTTDLHAARALCERAGAERDAAAPGALHSTMIAKYFSAGAAARAGASAVQILGAVGTTGAYPVERHYRDAKIMQIIEGSDQMQQLTISDVAMRAYGGGR